MKHIKCLFILLILIFFLLSATSCSMSGNNIEDITISELLVKNELNISGNFYDYIELYNNEDTEVSLDGWYLTDKDEEPALLPLAGKTIAAKGYLVIFLDESAGFALSTGGDSAILLKGSKTADRVDYEALAENKCAPDGMYEFPTPGYANDAIGYQAYLSTLDIPELSINEVLSTNSKHLALKGEYYDLLEIKNNTSVALNLKNYYISDKSSNLKKSPLPDVILEAGGLYVFYCSGLAGEGHLPFKISNSGEYLYIADENGSCIDAFYVPPGLTTNVSYGRYGKTLQYMTATFGEDNAEGINKMLNAPAASIPAGIHESAFSLSLSGDGDIYYTTNGSAPTEASSLYEGEITIEKNTTIRAICVSNGYISAEGCYSYLVGISHTIPVATLTTPNASIYGSSGIYTTLNKSREIEANFSYIENNNQMFSINCGVSIHGNDSNLLPKKGLQLHFRSEYGTGSLEYKIFDDLDITSFNSILLKAGGEDARSTVLRDELCTAVVSGASALAVQAYKPVILYLNGEYQGIYYIRERFTEDYVASHYNVDADSVSIVATYMDGNNLGYSEIESYIKNHNMRNAEAYEYIINKINALSLIDWFLCRAYFGDTDTANVRIFKSPDFDGGRWNWMFYDLDWAFYNKDFLFSSIVSNQKLSLLMYKLMQNEDFRSMTLKRCTELFETTLNEARIITQLDKIVGQIGTEIEADRAYWLKHDPYSSSYETWLQQIEKIKDFVNGDERKIALIKDLKQYCSLSDDDVKAYFGIDL